jgi:hypothetical protein
MPRPLFKRLLPWCLALVGLAAAIIGWLVLERIEPAESRSEVVVVVKADGSFYLASKPTIPLTRELLKGLLATANPQHCVIALDNSCPVKAIGPVLNATAEAGFAHYQLRTPESRLNFSLQIWRTCISAPEPARRWVDLRESATDLIFDEPYRPEQSEDFVTSTELAILVDSHLSVGELLKKSAPYTTPGKPVGIYVLSRYLDGELQQPPLQLLRNHLEESAHDYISAPPGPLAEKVSQWWNTFKNTVTSWF